MVIALNVFFYQERMSHEYFQNNYKSLRVPGPEQNGAVTRRAIQTAESCKDQGCLFVSQAGSIGAAGVGVETEIIATTGQGQVSRWWRNSV